MDGLQEKYTARLMLGRVDGEIMAPVKNIIHQWLSFYLASFLTIQNAVSAKTMSYHICISKTTQWFSWLEQGTEEP